jgi:perosamine synthetase
LELGVCPLFFPLLVKDKPTAARVLRERGVMATELWNEGDPLSACYEEAGAKFLRRHVLELPIHQDIREDQLRYIARQVVELRIALEPTFRGLAREANDRDTNTDRASRAFSVAASS